MLDPLVITVISILTKLGLLKDDLDHQLIHASMVIYFCFGLEMV